MNLDDSTKRLPRSVEPKRDLWPGIRARIEGERAAPVVPRSMTTRVRWGAIAASLLLMSIALVATMRSRAPGTSSGDRAAVEPIAVVAEPASMPASDPFLIAQREYVEAVEALLSAIESRQAALPPAEIEALRSDIELIDRAIHELSASFEKAPPAREHKQMLSAMYRKKIDLLWRVSRLSS